ncbi:hypothetical protein LPW11_04475 [Geomonas sp. RF6]|uniref:hypothetical protein n=1 Tax=Geomonas sp. RF6 TaxID=2897342 RepID=UPI001E4E7232|nr:hypothetical protein [Geomonas sp. RF6]UFS71455.1 hypothetical protein LPW11_04475 [Geomonas sp. RF6]
MGATRYRVRLARPVFQTVVVEVEAENRDEALAKAVSHAGMIPDEEWSGAFDGENYIYETQQITEVEDAPDDAAVFAYTVDRYTRYLLLKADTFLGEGSVIAQPWVKTVSGSVISDLCSNWAAELAKARDGGPLTVVEPEKKRPETTGLAKVIPIKRSGPKR